MKYFFQFIFFLLILSACDLSEQGPGALAPARGEDGEIILVIDPELWNGKLGNEIKETFMVNTPGLPRPQPLFSLKSVTPSKLNSVLKAAKNIIFVTSLDGRSHTTQFYTESSLQQIKEKPEFFMESASNRYASGQEVLYLFNPTVEGLIEKIRDNRLLLRKHFSTVEKKRFISGMKKSTLNAGARKILNEKHKVDMRIPKGYDIAINDDDFIWLRLMTPTIDKNIFISYRHYTSSDFFHPDSIVHWRNEIARRHIFADPKDKETYMTTELKYAPINSKNISFNGDYAVELRALWKTNKANMGGPFLSYTFYSDENKLLYYLEGFVYSPSKDQREFIRELEAILETFRPIGSTE